MALSGAARTWKGHTGWAVDGGFAPDDAVMYSGARDGTVRVTIVDSALVRALSVGGPPATRFARLVAEPDLAPPAPGWPSIRSAMAGCR